MNLNLRKEQPPQICMEQEGRVDLTGDIFPLLRTHVTYVHNGEKSSFFIKKKTTFLGEFNIQIVF